MTISIGTSSTTAATRTGEDVSSITISAFTTIMGSDARKGRGTANTTSTAGSSRTGRSAVRC